MNKTLARAGIFACVLLLSAASAQAQSPVERENARRMMDEGDHYVEKQEFEKALKAYQGAHAIMHVPTTGIEVALTLTTLGRMVEAREVALEVTNMPGAGTESAIFAEARKDAAELADRLVTKIPTLRIELPDGVEASTVRAMIDGQEVTDRALTVPKRLDPGKHVVRVESSGYEPFIREVTLTEAARSVVNVELHTAGTIIGLPPLAFAGLLAAAGGVAIGTVTGVMSLDKASTARDRCGPDQNNCAYAAKSFIDSSKTLGWVSTISFGIALAGGAVATYALLTKTDRVTQRTVGLHASPMGLFIDGTF